MYVLVSSNGEIYRISHTHVLVQEEGGDEYTYQEDDDDDDHLEADFLSDTGEPSARGSGRRRSQRAAALNANGKRLAPDGSGEWRGERRSTRLGTNPDLQITIPPAKRARTEESSASAAPSETLSHASDTRSIGTVIKSDGAAAVKPNEIALEQVAGKKKSKFWFYAVEPIGPTHGSAVAVPLPLSNGAGPSDLNGHNGNGVHQNTDDDDGLATPNGNGGVYEDSLSPVASLASEPGPADESTGWHPEGS